MTLVCSLVALFFIFYAIKLLKYFKKCYFLYSEPRNIDLYFTNLFPKRHKINLDIFYNPYLPHPALHDCLQNNSPLSAHLLSSLTDESSLQDYRTNDK